MRFDPGAPDKFAALFGARYPRKKKLSSPQGNKKKSPTPETAPAENVDEDVPAGVRLHKTARERQLEALERDRRLWKRYQASRQSRLDRLASEVPGVAKFLRILKREEPRTKVLAYRDIDLDLAALARTCRLAEVENPYDRFTVYEEAVGLVARIAKRSRRYTEPDLACFFQQSSVTTLDELKMELRLR